MTLGSLRTDAMETLSWAHRHSRIDRYPVERALILRGGFGLTEMVASVTDCLEAIEQGYFDAAEDRVDEIRDGLRANRTNEEYLSLVEVEIFKAAIDDLLLTINDERIEWNYFQRVGEWGYYGVSQADFL